MLVLAGVAFLLVYSPRLAAQQSAEDLYNHKCAVCHGKDGAGKTAKGKKAKVKDIHETIGKMSEEEMIKIVEKGKDPNMDSYKKEYSKEQIKEIGRASCRERSEDGVGSVC